MNTKSIPYDEWRTFLLDVRKQFAEARTTIRVKDHPPKLHRMELVSNLPLITIEHDARRNETIRFLIKEASGAKTIVEIENPRFITVLEQIENVSSYKSLIFEIETPTQTFSLRFGMSIL